MQLDERRKERIFFKAKDVDPWLGEDYIAGRNGRESKTRQDGMGQP
jgi:hypothetical protein